MLTQPLFSDKLRYWKGLNPRQKVMKCWLKAVL